MKTYSCTTTALFVVIAFLNPVVSTADNITSLNVGEIETQTASEASAVIGLENTADNVGFAFGQSNQVLGPFSSVFGYANFVDGFSSMAVGVFNQIHKTPTSLVNCSLAVGYANFIESGVSGSIVCGYENFVGLDGGSPPESVRSTATFGLGLKNKWNLATVLGKYNSITPPNNLLFAIGNGVDNNNRTNAVEVYTDGKVIIRLAQGDILMGEFGN